MTDYGKHAAISLTILQFLEETNWSASGNNNTSAGEYIHSS